MYIITYKTHQKKYANKPFLMAFVEKFLGANAWEINKREIKNTIMYLPIYQNYNVCF